MVFVNHPIGQKDDIELTVCRETHCRRVYISRQVTALAEGENGHHVGPPSPLSPGAAVGPPAAALPGWGGRTKTRLALIWLVMPAASSASVRRLRSSRPIRHCA